MTGGGAIGVGEIEAEQTGMQGNDAVLCCAVLCCAVLCCAGLGWAVLGRIFVQQLLLYHFSVAAFIVPFHMHLAKLEHSLSAGASPAEQICYVHWNLCMLLQL